MYYRINRDINATSTHINTSVSDTNSTVCGRNVVHKDTEHEVQKMATDWLTYINVITNCVAAVVILLMGALSDTIGRKSVLILPAVGSLIKFIIDICIMKFDLNLYFVLVSAFVEGLGGNHYCFELGCYSIASDNTKRNNSRSLGLGLFVVIMGIGLSGSEIAAGYLIKHSFLVPAYVAVGLIVSSLIICICCLQETMNNRQPVVLSHAFSDIKHTLIKFASQRKGASGNKFTLTFVTYLFILLPQTAGVGLNALFVFQDPFCWNPVTWGYYGAASNALSPLVSLITLKVLYTCLIDEQVTIIGGLAYIASNVLLGLAYNNWMLYGCK